MCLIFGFFNFLDSKNKSLKLMSKLRNRGLDGGGFYYENNLNLVSSPKENLIIKKDLKLLFQKIKNISDSKTAVLENIFLNNSLEYKNIVLGHLLHSIVNFQLQPLVNKGVFIANCEIYNWKNLAIKYGLNVKNDAELLFSLLEKDIDIIEIINQLEGAFAFAYLRENILYLARDFLGEKPLFYDFNKDKFAFASEKKVLSKNAKELNPRTILKYSLRNNDLEFLENNYFNLKENLLDENYDFFKDKTYDFLENAVLKMVPENQKIALLFSGGIDSTFIAMVLKKHKIPFTCYTALLEGGNIEEASDYVYAVEIAKKYDFELKVAKVKLDELEKVVKKIIDIIEDIDYIKISVALPFYFSGKKAKEDSCKVIFSGLGSEEIFAGYRRHKKVALEEINLECEKGLLMLHKRDLYRDDVICMSNNLELRLPFLDKNLVEFSFRIPPKYKIDFESKRSKIILRDISKEKLFLDLKYSERIKKAAQYGSKFDKGLLKLAKLSKKGKHEYLINLQNDKNYGKI